MEAAPRLPMVSFDLKVCTENTQFGPQLKQYIAAFYNEDPDSYSTEIHNLETLRSAAVRPTMDINGVQLLKKYYCQLHFLKSRFPMEENQDAAVQFLWRDNQVGMNCGGSDIRFELMVIMYNIGALHSYLGATDTRSTPDGMKMACTHFQCAAWAFQTVKEKFHQFVIYMSSVELIHFFQQVCLAQAQECILEKSMLDNRKATIIAKVAVQVYSYYRQSLSILQSTNDELVGGKTYKEWIKYLQFKVSYHKCVALLFQGQQAEEQQKMGERVAFYQAACEQLEEARKISSGLKSWQQEINESLAFTSDVVEGKRKAAKNENEFIYHEEVPDKDHLQEVKGASLVKGIPFSITDAEVSGPDIFARLVPMEAHEAASLYSETKAQVLRQMGELVESKDQSLAEFMSSMQLDLLTKVISVAMNQATGIPQELIDRAAALSAKPTATQDLVEAMGKLSNIYQEVESNLNEIDALLKEEEEAEKRYQELMGKRPPSIIATDLAREAAKYREAHTKANDSNQTLHRAMTAHIANLKILQQPLRQLQHQLPSIELPNQNIDEKALRELEALVSKVEEMRNQRSMLWAQFREAVHKDDITNSLVTKQPNLALEQLFQIELQKHQKLAGLIEQNCAAQENIRKALVDSYAKAVTTRRYVQEVIQKRNATISALIASHDSYDDLLAKANKGIEFYTKLETNVSKLLQRIKSACKVQQEEREQILQKNDVSKREDAAATASTAPITATPAAPKLKDYLESRKKGSMMPGYADPQPPTWPPAVRPAPLGSEVTDLPKSAGGQEAVGYPAQYGYGQAHPYQMPGQQAPPVVDQHIISRMDNLLSSIKGEGGSQRKPQHSYSNYIPQNYATSATTYVPSTQQQPYAVVTQSDYDPTRAYTTTTNSYRPLSSYAVPNISTTHMQYPDSSLGAAASDESTAGAGYHYQQQPQNPPPQGANVNTYYPTGYAPDYNAQTVHPSAAPTQYHSMEYATSVPANLVNYPSYNSTYSSPTPNISSVPAKPGCSGSSSYLPASTSGASGYTQPLHGYYPSAGTPNPQESGYSSGGTVGQSLPSPCPSSSQQNVPTPNVQDYSGSQSYTQQTQSYPETVAPGTQQIYPSSTLQSGTYPTSNTYSTGTGVSHQSTDNTYTQSYQDMQSYQGGTGSSYLGTAGTETQPGQYYATGMYQAPYASGTGSDASQQAYQAGSTSSASLDATGYGTYSNYYGQDYSQNYASGYGYVQQPAQQQQSTVSVPATTKESNIDLLSGLDFTISQAPLIPQQKTLPKAEEGEAKAAGSESKVDATKKPTVKEEKPVQPEIKRPTVKILPSKPLNNGDVKHLFKAEAEKYEKYVETLTNKTLSGPTNLDIKWKEIQEKQDSEGRRRVELCGTKDDYINASFVK
ncbi:hypothetical protein NQ318_020154, partial [Aromia moschata]